MRRTVFKSKIHRAKVTDGNLNYEGSLSIDADLLDAADILPHEQIHVWDVTNGTRLITYALAAPRGSGEVCVNGAGAHLIHKGNVVIIATFTEMKTRDARKYVPTVVFVDEQNKMKVVPGDPADVPAEVEAEPAVADNGTAATKPVKRRTRRR